jgi:hypothetical protein
MFFIFFRIRISKSIEMMLKEDECIQPKINQMDFLTKPEYLNAANFKSRNR